MHIHEIHVVKTPVTRIGNANIGMSLDQYYYCLAILMIVLIITWNMNLDNEK